MQAIVFLLDSVISFFCVLFLLRFMMQAMRVSFAGQPGNFVVGADPPQRSGVCDARRRRVGA